MTIFFFGILLKSSVLAVWALLYGFIFKRPYILNSDLLKYLGITLFVLIGYSALSDADFFTALFFLIYIGALMVLFLLAYLTVSLDSTMVSTTALAETWKSSPTLVFALHMGFFNATLLIVDRLAELKIGLLDMSLKKAPVIAEGVSLEAVTWLGAGQVVEQADNQMHYEGVAAPGALALELCTTYSLGLICIMLTLFVVLFGILSWVRNSYRFRV